MQLLVVFFMGPPGSGKGTHSDELVQVFRHIGLKCGVVKVSDYLEKLIDSGSDDSGIRADVKKAMQKGEFVPSGYAVKAFMDVLLGDEYDVIIADGSCRQLEETKVILDTLHLSRCRIDVNVIVLDIPWTESEKRISDRSKESGREDDQSKEVIRYRIKEYYDPNHGTKKSLNELRKNDNVSIHTINGCRETEDVFSDILNVLNVNEPVNYSGH